MPDEIAPQSNVWDRMDGEPAQWFLRFTRYRLLFPRRSVAVVYEQEYLAKTPKNSEKLRRNPDNYWYKTAKQWKWEERAEAWDAAQFAEEEKIKLRVMQSGYALQHNRILVLQEQLTNLLAMTEDEDKVWLPDVKAIGNGPGAERVDLVQFNDALFKEVREYLADIADEMGERVKKKEVSIKSLPSNVYFGFDPNQDGADV